MTSTFERPSPTTSMAADGSDEQYRTLFEHMLTGMIVMEVIYDAAGHPIDHRLLQANAEFERQTGLLREEEIGKTSAELSFKWPDHVRQRYYEIATQGGTLHWERYNESLERHFDVRVFSPRSGQFAVMFYDITERKRDEETLRLMSLYLDNASDSIFALDLEGKLVYANRQAWESRGYTREELMGMDLHSLNTPESAAQIESRMAAILERGKAIYEVAHRCKDGSSLPLEFSACVIEVDGRKLILSSVRDLTTRKEAERSLAKSETRLRQALRASRLDWFEVKIQTGEVSAGSEYPRLLGYEPLELASNFDNWLENVHPDDRAAVETAYRRSVESGEIGVMQYRRKKKDGTWLWIESTGQVTEWDADGKPLLMSGIHMDISDRKQVEHELIKLATTDFLTGLSNRRGFISQLDEELSRIQRSVERTAALLMLDLDNFKRINDSHGHSTGDELLKHFASVVGDELRRIDVAGRLGGEEFGILLPGAGLNDARAFADRLRRRIADSPLVVGDKRIAFTVSIGVAELEPDDKGPDHALARVDRALYLAKELGRNRVEVAADAARR